MATEIVVKRANTNIPSENELVGIFLERNPDASAEECVVFAKDFEKAHARQERETAGMSQDQRFQHDFDRMSEILIDAYLRSGKSHDEAVEATISNMELLLMRIMEYHSNKQLH